MHLYLIRHGESHVNLADWEGGHVDASLTKLGQKEAAALAAWLPRHLPQIDALYTSTMRRALETTAYLVEAYGQPAREDDRIREYGNNRLDHTPWPSDELPDTFADYRPMARPFAPITAMMDRDESWMHFRTRVGSFLEEVVERHPGQVVVAVCHGGVIQGTFDHIFNVGPWRRCEVWNRNTGITYLEYVNHPGREVWRLHYQNRVEHLGL
jgi:broad specificity phosphatase PhoE